MADEKNPKEASNIFHSIMKASVKPKGFDPEICPDCGLLADFVPPTEREGNNVAVHFKCPNGHKFSKYLF